jgi:Protein of unknown function (DUF3326)
MILNTQHIIRKSELSGERFLHQEIEGLVGSNALRWYIGRVTKDEIIVETTSYVGTIVAGFDRVAGQYYPGKHVVLNVAPTGVGCSIGGFAGDAAPATNLLAAAADYLITHPNAGNASDFIGLTENNIIYTDGCSMDLFCKGLADLHLPYSNRIGIIIEKADDRKLDVVFNIINAVRATHGVNITDYVITDEPIGGRCIENDSKAFVGTIDNPHVIFEACETLIRKGVDAIALTSSIKDLPMDRYASHFAGEYPNPVGGVEAIISYLVTSRYRAPAAHAPLINTRDFDLRRQIVDARAAGEFASTSGLACVLIGLRQAPQINPKSRGGIRDIINVGNLAAIVSPATCLGGVPALYAQSLGVPIIAVEENRTVLDVTQEKLGLENVIRVRSYTEAAGVLLALKKGINLQSLERPLRTYRY